MRAPFSETRTRVTKDKRSALLRRCRGTCLHLVPHQPFRLTTVRPRRLVALSRCPDAHCNSICVGDTVEWPESSERNQQSMNFLGRNVTRDMPL